MKSDSSGHHIVSYSLCSCSQIVAKLFTVIWKPFGNNMETIWKPFGNNMNKTLIIDNYDSFTYILKQYFGELGGNPEVFLHDKITINQIKRMKPTHIVLSPGPGTVEQLKDVGIMFDVIKEFYKKIPILGVCLGHQAIGKFFGGKIVQAPKIMHGKRSLIHHDKKGIFKGIKNSFEAMRYHSLVLDSRSLPIISGSDFRIIAQASDNIIMAIQHEKYSVFGIQFHPESLGTPEGKKIINNFLKSIGKRLKL